MEKRLETLKKALKMGWGELADAMGISRSMLDQVRKGNRVFSPKTLRQLEAMETQAGLRAPDKPKPPSEANLPTGIHTICTHLLGIEKALERIAGVLEKMMTKQEAGK